MATYRSLLEDAFEALALASYVFDLTDDEAATAYRKLDQMMAGWAQDGIAIGYVPAGVPVVDDANPGVPAYAEEAIYSNLALRLAPGFGKTPSGQLVRRARQSLAQLGSSKIPVLRAAVPIRGAGYRRGAFVVPDAINDLGTAPPAQGAPAEPTPTPSPAPADAAP